MAWPHAAKRSPISEQTPGGLYGPGALVTVTNATTGLPVTLYANRDRALPNTTGVTQADGNGNLTYYCEPGTVIEQVGVTQVTVPIHPDPDDLGAQNLPFVNLLPWQPNTVYVAGQLVSFAGAVYAANTNFTSGALFNPANWTLVSLGTANWIPAVRAVATSNIALSGSQTVDGVALSPGNRVLATAQTTGSQNGPWVVQTGAYTRPSDYYPGDVIAPGLQVEVVGGTNFADTAWSLAGTTAITVDTTATTWVQTFGPDSKYVHTSGNETVGGIKSFTASPIVPDPTTGTQAANKEYTDTKVAKDSRGHNILDHGMTTAVDINASSSGLFNTLLNSLSDGDFVIVPPPASGSWHYSSTIINPKSIPIIGDDWRMASNNSVFGSANYAQGQITGSALYYTGTGTAYSATGGHANDGSDLVNVAIIGSGTTGTTGIILGPGGLVSNPRINTRNVGVANFDTGVYLGGVEDTDHDLQISGCNSAGLICDVGTNNNRIRVRIEGCGTPVSQAPGYGVHLLGAGPPNDQNGGNEFPLLLAQNNVNCICYKDDGFGNVITTPWFENPGNGRQVTDGATTSASNILTSATAAFTTADVGRLVTGSSAIPGNTTISGFTNSTTVTLSKNATATASGVTLIILYGASIVGAGHRGRIHSFRGILAWEAVSISGDSYSFLYPEYGGSAFNFQSTATQGLIIGDWGGPITDDTANAHLTRVGLARSSAPFEIFLNQVVHIVDSGSASSSAVMNIDIVGANSARLQWQRGGVTKWGMQYSAGLNPLKLIDFVNSSRAHVTFTPGASNTAASTEFASKVQIDGGLDLQAQRAQNAADPTAATDLATMQWVLAQIAAGPTYIPAAGGGPGGIR